VKRVLQQSLVCLVLLVLWSRSVCGHADTIIRLDGDKLVGLPQEYQPAQLDLKAFRIRIREHTKDFSPWLKSLFEQPHDLLLSASWYHERSIPPPYLLMRILPTGRDFSYEILFDLDAVRIIKAELVLRESATTTRFVPVALSDHDVSKAAPIR